MFCKPDFCFSVGCWGTPALSGLLLALSFPTHPDHPLSWAHHPSWALVSLLPLFSYLPVCKWKKGFRVGCITGSSFSLYSLYWVAYTQGGGPAVIAGTLLMAAYIGLFYGLGIGSMCMVFRVAPRAAWLCTPFFWTALEYLLSLGELGFPWLVIGSTQANIVELIQYAEFTGVYGVSFWVVCVNATVWMSVRTLAWRPFAVGMATTTLLFAFPWWYSDAVIDAAPTSGTIRVGLIQNNIGLEKWRHDGLERSFATLESLSRSANAESPELIVWPETAVPCRVRTRLDCRQRIDRLIAELGVPIITGASDWDPVTREPYNSAFYFTPYDSLQSYSKMHLVPFGERTPFKDMVPWFRNIDWTTLTGDLGPAEFAHGKKQTLFSHPSGSFSVLICFESVFPDLVRKSVANGAAFLVIITNDSWFGRTAGPYQHAQLAAFRAVENRRAVARCATSGVSLFIDPYGRRSQLTEVYTQAAVVGDLAVVNERTFYTRHGDLFAQLITAVAIALTAWCARRSVNT